MTIRNKVSKLVLDCAGVTTVGQAIEITDNTPVVFLALRIEASATLLVSTLALRAGADPVLDDPATMPALLFDRVAAYTAPDAGIAYASSGGAVWTTSTPAVGVHKQLVAIYNPPPVIVPVFTFTSGGGTVRVRVKAVW